MQVVERDFTLKGKMKAMKPEDRKRVKGMLPFYSVDTREEADALIEAALKRGEFARNDNGDLVEVHLANGQTLDRLYEAGERLAKIHEGMKV